MKRTYSILILIILAVLLTSCRTIKYVPVPQVQRDSIYINRLQHDSIYQKDSIYIREKGDTTFFHTYKYIFIDKAIHDTLYVAKTDSVPVPYPVERNLTWWQKFKLDFGGYCILLILAVVITTLLKYKRRK